MAKRDAEILAATKALDDAIRGCVGTVSAKDIVNILLSAAAGHAVSNRIYAGCVEFEDDAHEYYHSALDILRMTDAHVN